MRLSPWRQDLVGATTAIGPGAQIDDYLREGVQRVDGEIQAVLAAAVHDSWLVGAISYHLGWADTGFAPLPPDQRGSGGKRLRPILALLSYQLALSGAGYADGPGGDDVVVPFAAAVEFIHNFSLIHDDIDDANQIRRGRPALWALCGQAQAINAGDALHALAYACLGRILERGADDRRLVVLATALARAVVDTTIGPRRDIAFDGAHVDMEMYVRMHSGKTAVLAACSTFGGALLALGETDAMARQRLASYKEFGLHLGLAFQIRDDVLGIWGDESDIGRRAGSDIQRRKMSLPVLFAFKTADIAARNRLRDLFGTTRDLTDEDEREIRDILERFRAGEQSRSRVDSHAERARRALARAVIGLDTSRGNRYLTALEQLAGSLCSRSG